MPLLTVQNLPGAVIETPPETTLLAALHAAGFDWRHACGAKGRCTTCRVQVLAGARNLAPLSEAELRYRTAGRLQPDERLTCQARLLTGELLVRVPEATKLPQVHYT